MSDQNRKNILLVEDEALVAMSEAMMLRKEGYETLLAASGEEAIAKVKTAEQGIDLILMDIDLGKGRMDGTQAAQEILKEHDIPVVFLSSHTEPGVVEKTEKITSYGYVVKNTGITVLAASIKMAFKLHAAHRAIQRANDSLAQEVAERRRAVETLRESEALLRQVVKYDPFAVAVHDTNMQYIAASDHWLRDYNVKIDDIIGKSHYEVFPEIPQRWKDIHQRCLAGAIERNDDDYFERPDGTITYNRWEMRPWYRLDGTIGGAISYTEVTTERKLLELARKSIIERYDLAIHAAGFGVWDWDIRKDELVWDERMYELYGLRREDFSGVYEAWPACVHPDDREASMEAVRQAQLGQREYDNEFRIMWPDGNVRWLKAYGQVIRDSEGNPIRMTGINFDITERKRAEEALADEATRRRILIEQSRDGIVILDQDGHVYEANQKFADMLGYPLDEMRKLNVFDWEYLYPRERVIEMIRTVDEKGDHFETKHRRRDGSLYDVEISTNAALFAGQKLIFCVCRDITGRKRVEEALRESETRYRQLIDSISEPFFAMDADLRFTHWNAAAQELFWLPSEQVIGKTMGEVYQGDWVEDAIETIRQVMKTGEKKVILFEFIREGRKQIAEITIYPFQNGISAFFKDITESKRLEAALQEERSMFIGGPTVVFKWVAEAGWPVEYVSPNVLEQFGYTVEDFTSRKVLFANIVHQDDLKRVAEEVDQYGQSGIPYLEQEYRIIRADGEARWLHDFTVVKRNEEGKITAYWGYVRDITVRKQSENALKKSIALYEALFDQAGDGVFLFDTTGKIISVNQTFAQMHGYSVEEMLELGLEGLDVEGIGHIPERMPRILAGETLTFEVEHIHKNGRTSSLEVTAKLVTAGDERLIIATLRDITVRKRVEERIANERENFLNVFAAAPVGLLLLDRETVITRVNRSVATIVLRDPADIIGQRAGGGLGCINSLENPRGCGFGSNCSNCTLRRGIESVLAGGSSIHGAEIELTLLIGGAPQPRWLNVNAEPIELDGKQYIIVALDDITERKWMEEALRESEEKLRTEKEFIEKLFSAAADTIFVFEPVTGKAVRWNEAFRKVSGYSDAEINALKAPDSYYDEVNLRRANEAIQRTLEEGRGTVELTLITKEGKNIPFEYSAAVVPDAAGAPLYFISIGRDLTERKRAEETLQESEERFRRLSRVGFEGIAITQQGKVIDINSRLLEMLGYNADEMIGQPVSKFVAPESMDIVMRHMSSGSEEPYEHLILRKDGSKFPAEIHARLIQIKGNPSRVTAIMDITERKRSEEELRSINHLLMDTQRMAKIGSWAYDLTTHALSWTPEVYRIFGLDPSYTPTLEGLAKWIHPDDLWVIAPETIEKNTRTGVQEMEYRIIDQTTGEIKHVIGKGETLKHADGRPFKNFGSFQDITERKQAEEALRQALADKETLLSELQHRVKNSLATAASLLALEEINLTDERSRVIFADARSRIKSMSTVYEQLSLGGGIDQIDFRQYIQNLIAMLSKSYLPPGGLVSIETQLDEVWLDAKRALPLGLILNELINNALKHAFPEGSAPGGAPGIISVELTKADSQVTLRVADNGVGLMKRASSASSGMGLSLVEMLSRQIGGSFTSESGEGYAALVSFNL